MAQTLMSTNWNLDINLENSLRVICLSILFIGFSDANNRVFAYETLEWQNDGMFASVNTQKTNSTSSGKQILKTKPSKLGKIRRAPSRTKSGRLKRRALRKRHTHTRVKYANLGNTFTFVPENYEVKQPKSNKRKTRRARRRGVIWAAKSSCLNDKLRSAIYHVARNWGRVRVNSTCRSPQHNRRVGGSKHSFHLSGKAADIRVWGNVRATARYLRKVAGGYKHYGGGLFHIDIGPRRSW